MVDHGPLDLAKAVADGTAVDWQAAEDAASSHEEREIVSALRVIGQIGEAHRSWRAEGAPGGGANTPADTPLDRWGHLEILALVGEGSYGEVYRARDVQLDREVALKLLRPVASSSTSDDSALAEGRLLARVRHPNVATVYGADRRAGRVGLWMEFIAGHTLSELLRDQGPFGPREAALAGIELCRAVAAVHGQGIVHRDIKAQNVMREKGGRIVLTDFGIGKDLQEIGPTERSISGTPLYLAPELLVGGHATRSSDIYALGVLLYHLVTRSFPVRGASLAELRDAHERGEVRLLRDARPDLPEAFVRVVERALAKAPERRYPSAGALEKALAGVLAESAERTPRLRPSKGVRVLAVVAVCLTAGLIVWAAHRVKIPRHPERVLIGEIENRTGRDGFDVVHHLLRLALEQSPHVQIQTLEEVRETLDRMRKPPGARLDRAMEREICQRQNVGTLITGEVAPVEGGFRLVVTATDPEDGTVRAFAQGRVADERQLLTGVVDDIAATLRSKLGEPSSSPAENRRPLEQVTTKSLEALQLYTKALDLHAEGKLGPAIEKLQAAVDRDPSFALAYSRLAIYQGGDGRLAEAQAAADKAYALLDHVSRRESYRIAGTYHANAMQYEKALDDYAKAADFDPRDADSLRQAALIYVNMGRPDEGLVKAREAHRRNPEDVVDNGLPALILAIQGRADSALEEVKTARQRFPAGTYLFWPEGIAWLVRGDTTRAEAAFEKLANGAAEDQEYKSNGQYYLVQSLIHRGKLQQAARALEADVSLDTQAGYQRNEMIRNETLARVHLLLGTPEESRRAVGQLESQLADIPLHLKPLRNAALLEVRLGNLPRARQFLARIEALRDRYPSYLSRGFSAQVRGEIEAASGNLAAARDSLETAGREWRDPKTVESLARYWSGRGSCDRAAPLEEEILRQKGWILHEFFTGEWVEAHLELARCDRLLGKTAEARAHYGEFLSLWREADHGLPLVRQAQRELQQLPPG
ncbi:MAG TPA: protein kinase [Thermoanaerobaculia bacterium]|nr:protein kinase [Thermoanaerobaculia bacterium]